MFDLFQQYVAEHPEWWAMMAIFWVIGHFMEKSVFTKAKAQAGKPQWFWWWARESMEIHPIVAGALLGLVYKGVLYFASAGLASLFFWKILSLILKKMYGDGTITLPGESQPPKS